MTTLTFTGTVCLVCTEGTEAVVRMVAVEGSVAVGSEAAVAGTAWVASVLVSGRTPMTPHE